MSSILGPAFHPAQRIKSGKLDLSFGFSATGVATLTAPVSLRLQGPFQSTGAGQLPRFDMGVDIGSSGRKLTVGATSTGSQFFIKLQGVPFQAPDSAFQQLKAGYAQSTAASSKSRKQSTLASLGIDPSAWLVHPRRAADRNVGGVDSAHVTAGLNVARFLGDLTHIAGVGGSLGLGGVSSVPSGLSASQRAALARSVTSARVDVYSGKGDHVLRELSLSADIAAQPAASATLRGLRTGTLTFRLLFSDLNQPQTIVAPSSPQPLSKLAGLLQPAGSGAAGAASGASGAASGGTAAGGASAGGAATGSGAAGGAAAAPSTAGGASGTPSPAYVRCAQGAGQSLAALGKCASLFKQP